MNLMLINVSTRKLQRAVWLPEGDVPTIASDAMGGSTLSDWPSSVTAGS